MIGMEVGQGAELGTIVEIGEVEESMELLVESDEDVAYSEESAA